MSGDDTKSGEGWCPLSPSAVLKLSVAALVPPEAVPWNSPQNASAPLAAWSWEGCSLPCPACAR
eukprot:13459262-Alexandrium_andersonii.AAC.1